MEEKTHYFSLTGKDTEKVLGLLSRYESNEFTGQAKALPPKRRLRGGP